MTKNPFERPDYTAPNRPATEDDLMECLEAARAGDQKALAACRKMNRFFIDNVPEDQVPELTKIFSDIINGILENGPDKD